VSFDPILELAPSTNSLKVIRTQAGEADDAMTRRSRGAIFTVSSLSDARPSAIGSV
jgi:hypothetical protein